jgi:hypothetical protein
VPPPSNRGPADFQTGHMIRKLPLRDEALVVVLRAARAAHETAEDLRRRQLVDPPVEELISPFDDDAAAAILYLATDPEALNTYNLAPAPIDELAPLLEDMDLTPIVEADNLDNAFALALHQGGHIGDPSRIADDMAYEAAEDEAEAADGRVQCLGEEDKLTPAERATRLTRIEELGLPYIVSDGIDGTLGFRKTSMGDFWCSAVMGVHGSSFATCITTKSATLITLNDSHAWYWMDAQWRRLTPKLNPVADGFGLILPTLKWKDRVRFAAVLTDPRIRYLCGFSGNPAILMTMLLGYMDAALQPSCMSWDAMVAHAASIIGFEVVRLDTGQLLAAGDVRELLIDRLRAGVKLPDLAIARDQASMTRLLQVLPPGIIHKTA